MCFLSALKQRVSVIEAQCAEKLREMEVHVQTAKKEHTKAVMTLRLFEKEAARSQNEMKKLKHSHGEKTKKGEVSSKYPLDTEIYRDPLQATRAQKGMHRDVARPHTEAQENFAASKKYRHTPPERNCTMGAEDLQASDERLLCFLEELHTLSAAVVNSSEDSAEEEGQSDSVGPAKGSLHS